ncbi:Nicotinamide-nucleotide adenylyltransferase [Ascochyta rabiei]|uniref:Nicotinamide-nucleotide adenylyltransferase n=1 Tax=Didymella rabiei TaxID=5454 RepID=UPI0021FCFFEB|nr:Nicotinamide-nucleotide adenylyltransferase [Ascochyta rabiei]UPX20323.1 Nicotinamide-nucleotide adenylyltransferase [Ascochyta rabiei]
MTSPASSDIALDAGLEHTNTVTLDNYKFPKERLKKVLSNDNKQPIVLVSCGSFSPPTNLHLRMFEEATDYCQFETDFEVVGGFFSPVGDAYKKAGLASAHHRISMTRIAVNDSSTWIGVDPWEPLHKEYMPTVKVLDHFDHELNQVLGGIATSTGEKKKIHVALLAGADLIQTMSTPGLWAREDLSRILGVYGAFILERSGTDIGMFDYSSTHATPRNHANAHQTMRLSVSSSGKRTSASFLSSSRTTSRLPRSACSASAARAFVTTSRTRSSTTSTSTACTLRTTRSQRRPRRARRRLLTVQPTRLQWLPLERSQQNRSERLQDARLVT